MYRILGSSAERLKQQKDMKAQREFHRENRKNRQLMRKGEHTKPQKAFELQKIELHTQASAALSTIIQEMQNQRNH